MRKKMSVGVQQQEHEQLLHEVNVTRNSDEQAQKQASATAPRGNTFFVSATPPSHPFHPFPKHVSGSVTTFVRTPQNTKPIMIARGDRGVG